MPIVTVSDANMQDVIKSNPTVLVDFWAPWCGPCLMIAPILEELSKEMGDKLVVAKLNVDENPVTASKYQIMSIPTMKLFRNGEEKHTMVGLQPKRQLKETIEYFNN